MYYKCTTRTLLLKLHAALLSFDKSLSRSVNREERRRIIFAKMSLVAAPAADAFIQYKHIPHVRLLSTNVLNGVPLKRDGVMRQGSEKKTRKSEKGKRERKKNGGGRTGRPISPRPVKIRPVAPRKEGGGGWAGDRMGEGAEGRKGREGGIYRCTERRDIATALAAPCSLHYRSRSTIWSTTTPRLPT